MMSVYLVGHSGTCEGIQKMLYMMNHYRSRLLLVIKFKLRGEDVSHYTFIALFQEPGSVGNFTALVNHSGATSGYSGSGPTAYAEMMSFIEEYGLKVCEADWDDIEYDYPAFREKLRALGKEDEYTGAAADVWRDFLSFYIWGLMPRLDYRTSEAWKVKASKKG